MRRLRDGQFVELGIGSYSIACRVVAINDDEAALIPLGLAGHVRLPAFTSQAALVFRHGPGIVMLKGNVRVVDGPEDLRFTVNDGVQLRQLRRGSRLAIELPCQVTPLGAHGQEGDPIDLRTVDVGPTGFGLGGRAGALGDRVRVRLELPGDEAALEADARIVRDDADGCAVQLEALARLDRDRLLTFIFARKRKLALAASGSDTGSTRRPSSAAWTSSEGPS